MIQLDRGDIEQPANFRTNSNGKDKKSSWTIFAGWDKLLLVFVIISLLSALAALFVLLTPLLDVVLDFMGLNYLGWNEWQARIVDGDRGLIVVVVLGLCALFFALLARYRVRRNYSVYAEAGCPQCYENELIRVRRNRRDRALAFFGLPVRRYSCRNCTWHGVRLAGFRPPKNREVTEGSEVDQFKDEMIEAQPEFAEETLPIAEVQIEAVVDTELQALNGDAAPVLVEDLVNPVEESSAINEATSQVNSGYEEKLDAPARTSETIAIEEPDDDSLSDEQIADDPVIELVVDHNEFQSDLQEENVDDDNGSDSTAEDNDFDRLCREVAQSKE